MLPVLNAEQIRACDAHTISNEPVASIDLMERAARRCADRLMGLFPAVEEHRFLALCGTGNNGGDGLAIARMLHEAGRSVRAVLCMSRPTLSANAQINLERLNGLPVVVVQLAEGSGLPEIASEEVVIDALLGTGLDRPLTGWLKDLVAELNRRKLQVTSIDMPSGLFSEDNAGNDPTAIVKADRVLTFEVPKLALLLPENAPCVGRWETIPIGLDPNFMDRLGSDLALTELKDVAAMLPSRGRFDHKGSFGHALLIAGGVGKMGAAILTARACARSGVGLVTAHVPQDHQHAVHSSVPEVMLSSNDEQGLISDLPKLASYSSIGVGPGIGTADETARALKFLIQGAPVPLVLDADALNILAENRTWLAFLPKNSILTPHPKEFDRLTEKSATGYERLQRAKAFAIRFSVVLVLKGAFTAVCSPTGKVYFNPTGNPGMAKGGSGDALTGIITGLLAQGIPSLRAATLGVFAHGMAGDLAAEALGKDGMLPSV